MNDSVETTTEKRKRAPSKKFYAFDGQSVHTSLGAQEVAEMISANPELKVYEQTQVGTYDLTATTVNDKFRIKTTVAYQA